MDNPVLYRGEPLSYWERRLARCERSANSKLGRFHNSVLKDEFCSAYMEEISTWIVWDDFEYIEVPTADDLEFDDLFGHLFDYQRNLLVKYLKQEVEATRIRRIIRDIKKRG